MTENELKVVFDGELNGEKDSTLLSMPLRPTDTLMQLSKLKVDILQEVYSNPCIEDGSQITVQLENSSGFKQVHLSNYYHDYIGRAIHLINRLTPKEYHIWYDKAVLRKQLIDCKQ